MKYIIDRIEGGIAICEDESGTFLRIKKEKLPHTCKEGDCIEYENGAYFYNKSETLKRREEVVQLLQKLEK